MANQYTKRKDAMAIETTPRAAVTASEELLAEAAKNRDATPPARAPEPIPEGDLFTVRAFGHDGQRVQPAEATVFGGTTLGACSHEKAVEACTKANAHKIASNGSVWFGVVEAGE